jgi:hypothetical protein
MFLALGSTGCEFDVGPRTCVPLERAPDQGLQTILEPVNGVGMLHIDGKGIIVAGNHAAASQPGVERCPGHLKL